MSDKKVEVLTDEMASAIWSGSTASIAGLEEKMEEQDDTNDAPEEGGDNDDGKVSIDPSKAKPVNDDDFTKIWAGEDLDEEEEEEEEQEEKADPKKATPAKTQTQTPPKQEPAKANKRITEFANMVNQLVEEGELEGFTDDDENITPVKTIEEAKELIKANLAQRANGTKDEVWQEKVKEYSPQIQTILKYAEQGAQSATELMELLGSIKEVEDANELDTSTDEGAEAVVREAYRLKGFKDAYIEKNIKRLKDLDALKEEADELSPEIVALKAQEVKKKLEAQARRQQEAMEASKVYFKTIQDTLSKDNIGQVKLTREDKGKIYAALADDRYVSLSGTKTNQFVRTLEELQFGKNTDYEHFLNVVQFTVDPKGFVEKLKAGIKQEVTADTTRKLKSAKSTTATTEEIEVRDSNTKKSGIKKGGFKNPYL